MIRRHLQSTPQGKLHVLASAAYGHYVAWPVVQDFAEHYPYCQISRTFAEDVSESMMTCFRICRG